MSTAVGRLSRLYIASRVRTRISVWYCKIRSQKLTIAFQALSAITLAVNTGDELGKTHFMTKLKASVAKRT